MEQQELWPENPKTTPPQEMPPESQSQNNNGNTDAEIEEQARSLIGMLLKQALFIAQLLPLLEEERLSNLGTPVMEVHLSSALLAMVSLTMSTSDLLKTYSYTWKASLPISLSEDRIADTLFEVHLLIEETLSVIHDW